jgi:hypothetical protein
MLPLIKIQKCLTCLGTKRSRCQVCNGSGHDANGKTCYKCAGLKNTKCSNCDGEGNIVTTTF